MAGRRVNHMRSSFATGDYQRVKGHSKCRHQSLAAPAIPISFTFTILRDLAIVDAERIANQRVQCHVAGAPHAVMAKVPL